MWDKQCHRLLDHLFGNGKHTTYKKVKLEIVYGIVLPTHS